jgi:hypothetical protein
MLLCEYVQLQQGFANMKEYSFTFKTATGSYLPIAYFVADTDAQAMENAKEYCKLFPESVGAEIHNFSSKTCDVRD